jgi:hypothetical protein
LRRCPIPNWCNNTLRIIGPKDEITRFIAQAEKDDRPLDFEQFIPMPDLLHHTVSGGRRFEGSNEMLHEWYAADPGAMKSEDRGERRFTLEEDEQLATIGFRSWYDWSIANWGTKWNAGTDTQADRTDREATYTFDTAWAPPEPVVAAMAAQFPLLKFQLDYSEPGAGFAGRVTYEKGEESGSEQHDTVGEIWDDGEEVPTTEEPKTC